MPSVTACWLQVNEAPEMAPFEEDPSTSARSTDLGQENVVFESSTKTSPVNSEEKLDSRLKQDDEGIKERKGLVKQISG